jgi:DNA-binding transcriptional LysR family regulator
MELRLLRYFVAVAEELHFSRAAERLHMAQPPLSQQIRALEAELGVQLFRRTRRRVELTEPGRVFLASARDILARAETAVEEVRRAARGEVGRLIVGVVGSAAYEDAIPGALRAFRERYPDVAIALRELPTGEQLAALRDGRIHIGFLRPPAPHDGIVLETVFREPLIAALPAAHRLAEAREIAVESLAEEPFVMVSREQGLGLHDLVMGVCAAAGFQPRVTQEAIELQTIIGLVAAGFGLSLVPAAARRLQRSGVTYVPLAPPGAEVEIAAAWPTGEPSPALAAFLGLLRERGAGL